ncbi:MAG: RNA polymerase sigma factor [Flavobacteriaceae bacterium]|nr:RNA polymerase sigma factor [Flavobacteriaceae bacterium]
MQVKSLHIDQLIERCKKADKSAQFELYKRYYKAMYNTAYRILNDSFEAEDVMQESFLIAYTKLGTFKAEKKEGYDSGIPFGAWLKRIVINKSLTQLRKANKYTNLPLENIGNSVEEEETSDYSVLKADVLLKEIKNLKNNYQLVLNLHFIEGFDYREMAQIMDVSYQNIRVLMSRAKCKLKKNIKHNYEKIS